MVRTRNKRKSAESCATSSCDSDEHSERFDEHGSAHDDAPALDELEALQLRAWLDEYDVEVSSRARALRAQAEDEVMVLKRELDIQLMKFPKRIRQMTVAEFEREHGGDLLLASARKSTSASASASASASVSESSYRSGSVFATPRAASTSHSASSSAATPLSARSVQKRAELTQRYASTRAPLQPTTLLPSLNVANLAKSKASKASARAQIAQLQNQLSSLMATLASPSVK